MTKVGVAEKSEQLGFGAKQMGGGRGEVGRTFNNATRRHIGGAGWLPLSLTTETARGIACHTGSRR